MNKARILFMLVVLSALFFAGNVSSYAANITGKITADNVYAIYIVNETGNARFVGSNESEFNWSHAETWDFDMYRGEYLCIASWSDDDDNSGLLGEFTNGDDGSQFVTDSQWQVTGTAEDLDPGDPSPGISRIEEVLMNADSMNLWESAIDSRVNGSYPWGVIPEISTSARWIWKDSYDSRELESPGEFLVFKFRPEIEDPHAGLQAQIDELGRELAEAKARIEELEKQNAEQSERLSLLEEAADVVEEQVNRILGWFSNLPEGVKRIFGI